MSTPDTTAEARSCAMQRVSHVAMHYPQPGDPPSHMRMGYFGHFCKHVRLARCPSTIGPGHRNPIPVILSGFPVQEPTGRPTIRSARTPAPLQQSAERMPDLAREVGARAPTPSIGRICPPPRLPPCRANTPTPNTRPPPATIRRCAASPGTVGQTQKVSNGEHRPATRESTAAETALHAHPPQHASVTAAGRARARPGSGAHTREHARRPPSFSDRLWVNRWAFLKKRRK